MNIQQIQYFITVARELSFTKAAEILYTSQPNISRQISILEETLGFALLIRSKKQVKLTQAGAIMLTEFVTALEHIENGIKMSSDVNQGKSGQIFIGYLEILNPELFIPRCIMPFQEKYPNVKVALESRSFLELRNGLNDKKFDIIFTLDFDVNNLHDIVSTMIYKSQSILLMSATHPLAQKENCSLFDFRDETFILPSEVDSPGRLEDLNRICGHYGFPCKNILHVPNVVSQLLYVRSGLGVALMDVCVLNIQQPYYSYMEIPTEPAPISIVAARKQTNLNPAIPLFVNSFYIN